jgi:hypothetical protein
VVRSEDFAQRGGFGALADHLGLSASGEDDVALTHRLFEPSRGERSAEWSSVDRRFLSALAAKVDEVVTKV